MQVKLSRLSKSSDRGMSQQHGLKFFGILYFSHPQENIFNVSRYSNSADWNKSQHGLNFLEYSTLVFSQVHQQCRWPLQCGKYMSGHLSHSSLFSDHIPQKHELAALLEQAKPAVNFSQTSFYVVTVWGMKYLGKNVMNGHGILNSGLSFKIPTQTSSSITYPRNTS